MIGLQVYTVRDKTGDKESALATMRAIKEMGYECVQLAGNVTVLKNCKEACDEIGLRVIGILSSASYLTEHFDFIVELAGSERPFDIGISSGVKTEEEAKALVLEANALAKRFRALGFTFSYHNHSNEFISGETAHTLMDVLREGFEPLYIDYMPDTYWLQHGGIDVRDYLEGLHGRARIIHLKDMKRTPDGQTFSPLGEGNMNFCGIVSLARSIGVEHFIVEQDICESDSLECARVSYNHLKGIL